MLVECIRNETIYGKTIPAKEPLGKWKKKIPLKWFFFLFASDKWSKCVVIIWFSCHSKTPWRPHFFHDGISLNVIAAVDIMPPIKPSIAGYNDNDSWIAYLFSYKDLTILSVIVYLSIVELILILGIYVWKTKTLFIFVYNQSQEFHPIISLFTKSSKAGLSHPSDRIRFHCSFIVPYLKQFFIQCSHMKFFKPLVIHSNAVNFMTSWLNLTLL